MILAKDHKGNTFRSLKEMASFYDMNYFTFMSRLNHGWTIDRILTTPVIKAKRVKINSEEFSSYAEMCRKLGIKTSLFKYYIKRGLPPQEAVAKILKGKTK